MLKDLGLWEYLVEYSIIRAVLGNLGLVLSIFLGIFYDFAFTG
jgi:hypothetical protein